MQKNKTTWYFLLCVLICILPVACDVQKRLYRPGYFIQRGNSLPAIPYLSGKDITRNIPEHTIGNSSPTAFNARGHVGINYTGNKPIAEKDKNSLRTYIENKQLHNELLIGTGENKTIVPPEKVNTNIAKVRRGESDTITSGKDNVGSITEPVKNNEYEDLILAFLTGAGSVLLFLAIRRGVTKGYPFNRLNNSSPEANKTEKTKKEIANMADRLDRCADRFANANNEKVEIAARKAAVAISKCNDLGKAKKLEKAFNDLYLSPTQASSIQHLKLNNLLSNDIGYGGGPGTLKPDVVTTTGGYYANSAGSLSWTLGEPISETVSDVSNTLTQGFQQGSYFILSVVELAQPKINISAYPNPVTSLLNIKSASNDLILARLIDLQGKIISEQSFENGQGQIDLSNLSDALYILGVYDKNGNKIKVFKIQKAD